LTSSRYFEGFEVYSAGVPRGWLCQANPDRQLAAFVMPLAHKDTLPDAAWQWETMLGFTNRRVTSERLWWAWGLYADVGSGENLYLAYIGASGSVNPQWTLSAVLPWPAVLFAPSENTLFRIGASPSGTSWNISGNGQDMSFELDTLDLGVSAEQRPVGGLWLRAEAGIGGLRGVRVAGSSLKGADIDVESSTFFSLSLNFRLGIDH
jgi:hypothetical protein